MVQVRVNYERHARELVTTCGFFFGYKSQVYAYIYDLRLILLNRIKLLTKKKLSQYYSFHFYEFQTQNLTIKDRNPVHRHQHPLVLAHGFHFYGWLVADATR